MPNICENVLRVQGETSELMRFDETFQGGTANKEYSFNNLYSSPPFNDSETIEWCRRHWNVREDFYKHSFSHTPVTSTSHDCYYFFDTAFVEPSKLIKKVSTDFPSLSFMLIFSEDGTGYGGIKRYECGMLVSKERLTEADIKYWFGEDEERKGA